MLTINVRYCNVCAHAIEHRVPEGDHLPRHICTSCGHIQYFNPRIIVGCIVEAEDGRVLMCRRNIEPRFGLWTFPAGFMEQGETTGQGAARETEEEAQARVEITGLVSIISVPYVSQVFVVHRGRMLGEHHGVTPESSATQLMHEREIPWDEIAFPTVFHSLRFFFADRAAGQHVVHTLDLTVKFPRPLDQEVSTGQPLP